MAKFHLDRLKDKYGWKTAVKTDNIRGKRYQSLIDDILGASSGNIQRAAGRISQGNYDHYAKGVRKKGKRFVLPDVSEALPKRSVYFTKAAERGQLITDTLRDRLTKDLREVLASGALRTTGKDAGSVNPKAIQALEAKISGTFSSYTKKDPKYGVPTNIKQIATTELRSNVSAMKSAYTAKLLEQNPGMVIKKKWRQNRSLSKQPRKTHHTVAMMAAIPYDENFTYRTETGQLISTPHPHHWSMPAGEVIGCNCDMEYHISRE